jgi:hypothetical protein
MVESENRARFSHKEGECTLTAKFFSGSRLLIDYLSPTDVGTETNATSVTKLIEVPHIPSTEVYCLSFSFSDF